MASKPIVLTIHEDDVTTELCQRCAKCCHIDVNVPSVDSRYRRFLRGVGFKVSPAISEKSENNDDCCDEVHDITLHLGPYRHLRTTRDELGTVYSCDLYGDARRPQLCEEFNCVSWAKALNRFTLENSSLVAAQAALDQALATTSVGANDGPG